MGVHQLRERIRLFRKPEPKLDWHETNGPEVVPELEPEFDMEGKPQRYYPEIPENIGDLAASSEKVSVDGDLKHLIDLVRSLRTALRGDLSRGIKPDDAAASRYWTALDHFLARFA